MAASKVTPLFKGKGDATLPDNYRSIAVAPPFAKLLMTVMTHHLTAAAIDLDLHAPTQAGFRAHYRKIEQALILQTLVQHSIKIKNLLCLAFIDLKRAYDSINRAKIW